MFEEVAPKRIGAFRDVFLVILCGLIFLSLPNWIPALFGFPFVKAIYEFLVFLGIVLLIYRYMRSYATEYKYALVDTLLTVRTKIGAKETVVAQIHLTANSELIPLKDRSDLFRENRRNPLSMSYGVSDQKSAYLLRYPLQNGKSALIFQPSEQFVEILQQLLLDKSEKM